MSSTPEIIEAQLAAWSGIVPPNDAGRRLAAALVELIAAFEALPDRLCFEDEPADFAAALIEAKE